MARHVHMSIPEVFYEVQQFRIDQVSPVRVDVERQDALYEALVRRQLDLRYRLVWMYKPSLCLRN